MARVSSVLGRAGGTLPWALLPMGDALALESYGWAWAFRRSGHDVPFAGVWRARGERSAATQGVRVTPHGKMAGQGSPGED